jgi:hypothetical protein
MLLKQKNQRYNTFFFLFLFSFSNYQHEKIYKFISFQKNKNKKISSSLRYVKKQKSFYSIFCVFFAPPEKSVS